MSQKTETSSRLLHGDSVAGFSGKILKQEMFTFGADPGHVDAGFGTGNKHSVIVMPQGTDSSENLADKSSTAMVDQIENAGAYSLKSAKLVRDAYLYTGLANAVADGTEISSVFSKVMRMLQISDAMAMLSGLSVRGYHHTLTSEIQHLPVLDKMRQLKKAEQYLMLATSVPEDISGLYTIEERELLLGGYGAKVDAKLARLHQGNFCQHIIKMSREQLIRLADTYSQQYPGIDRLRTAPVLL
ncbi:hypothetical protein [Thalassomonas sp. RHCl1]|uniref:hypothetical protein n=1 Tax=Thalassomonas sp. RHCl1 TaxID=2995320 RepID=UPI00248CADFD|nr:hypothetical protein [Thalassomonas sp. RHCl1]